MLKSKDELKKKGIIVQFGLPPNRIDLLNSIDGVGFGKREERRDLFYWT